jgi:hypothetical protein
MAELREVDTIAIDCDSFGAKAEPLFEAGFALQPDYSLRSQHPVPGHALARAQRPDDLTGRSGEAAGFGHIAICGDLALRYTPDDL